jgi:hypothetical protein
VSPGAGYHTFPAPLRLRHSLKSELHCYWGILWYIKPHVLTLDSLTSLIYLSGQKRPIDTVASEPTFIIAYIDSYHADAVGCGTRMDNVGHRRSKYQAFFRRRNH